MFTDTRDNAAIGGTKLKPTGCPRDLRHLLIWFSTGFVFVFSLLACRRASANVPSSVRCSWRLLLGGDGKSDVLSEVSASIRTLRANGDSREIAGELTDEFFIVPGCWLFRFRLDTGWSRALLRGNMAQLFCTGDGRWE